MKRGAAVIIVNKKDEILLVKRGKKNRGEKDVWENVGGEIDVDETLEDAARREVREETSCELTSLEEFYTDIFGDWQITVFRGKTLDEPKISEEHVEMRWFKKSELKDLPLASYTQADFKKLGWF